MAKFITPPSGNLPLKGKRELAEVYASCRERQTAANPRKGMCAAVAWSAVEENYVKVKDRWKRR